MDDWRIFYSVKLTSQHAESSRTRHTVYGKVMARPAELRIVKYAGADGFYLFYCDETGKEMNDTYHDTVEKAMEQAEYEFGIRAEEWKGM